MIGMTKDGQALIEVLGPGGRRVYRESEVERMLEKGFTLADPADAKILEKRNPDAKKAKPAARVAADPKPDTSKAEKPKSDDAT